MEIPKTTKKDVITIAVIGALTSVFSATLPIDIGGGIKLTSKEAWEQDMAPVMVSFGLILVFLSYHLFKGKAWTKWPIILWLPIFILTEVILFWGDINMTHTEFLLLCVPVMLIWLWSGFTIFRRDETIEYICGDD